VTIFVEGRDRFGGIGIFHVMSSLRPRRSIGLFLALTTVALAGCDEQVVTQTSKAARAAYEDQAQLWNQWALGQPHSTDSPIADPTGAMCANDQSGKVWYLAGTFGGPVERSCTIPPHRHLFFPLLNRWVINPGTDVEDEAAQAELIEFATGYFAANREATCALTLRLDGEDLLGDDIEELDDLLYTDVLDPFLVDIDPDNWATQYGFEGGPTPMVTDGHFALLRPLAPGEHTLEFGGTVCDGDAVDFETFATYTLTVEE
jgi:hypothetical protein